MKQFRQWFDSLAPRERLAVIAGAIAVVIALFYFLIWSPLDRSVTDRRVQRDSAAEQTRWMLGVRDEAQQLQAGATPRQVRGQNESLLSIVDVTSRDNELGEAVRRIQPDNDDQATVTLDNASFNRMMRWLRTLQSEYGITPRQMTITRDDAAGTVQARLTLARVRR